MDKIAALRAYDGKRIKIKGDAPDGTHLKYEGLLEIRQEDGEERVYITRDDGLVLYVSVDELKPSGW